MTYDGRYCPPSVRCWAAWGKRKTYLIISPTAVKWVSAILPFSARYLVLARDLRSDQRRDVVGHVRRCDMLPIESGQDVTCGNLFQPFELACVDECHMWSTMFGDGNRRPQTHIEDLSRGIVEVGEGDLGAMCTIRDDGWCCHENLLKLEYS